MASGGKSTVAIPGSEYSKKDGISVRNGWNYAVGYMPCYVLWLDGSSFPRSRKAFAGDTGQKAVEGQGFVGGLQMTLIARFCKFKKQNR